MSDLHRLTACAVVDLLKQREVSATEVLDASLHRIAAVNGTVNALPELCAERARDVARRIDAAGPEASGLLAGLPIAVKDYNDLAGVRTTYGSPIFADNVPARSDATVARLEAQGANPVGKSNVPEWAGGNTFNPVYGKTLNPWNTGRTAGGSSGGSAAALATGMVWLATGNDLGGSLRTPAAFNSVVGLRPGPGVVPRGERLQAFDTLWVEGPMGRCVNDVALMLDAGCGHDPFDPFSFDPSGDSYRDQAGRDSRFVRAAFSRDLGIVPMAREIAGVCETAARRCEALGVALTDEVPDFTGATDGFQTLRAVLLGTMMGTLLEQHRDQIAPDIVGNVERGFAVTPHALFKAERDRWALYQRMARFFESHDFLMCPAVSIAPFPIDQKYVEEIDGKPCETYIDWFAITFALTMTSCPVVSLPCGFTADGLPVGLQIVGPPRSEGRLLSFARQMETVLGVSPQTPIDPRSPL
jgi:amidase